MLHFQYQRVEHGWICGESCQMVVYIYGRGEWVVFVIDVRCTVVYGGGCHWVIYMGCGLYIWGKWVMFPGIYVMTQM